MGVQPLPLPSGQLVLEWELPSRILGRDMNGRMVHFGRLSVVLEEISHFLGFVW